MTNNHEDRESYEIVQDVARNTKVSISLEGWPAATAIGFVSSCITAIVITYLIKK